MESALFRGGIPPPSPCPVSVRLGGFSGLDAAGAPERVPAPGGTAPNEAMEDERGEAPDPLESDAGPMPPPT